MNNHGYTKLFGGIVGSTIWREAKETKIVWITMLALADRNGFVEASIPGLADFSKVTLEECEASLRVLLSPDKYSRTKDHEGRRIAEIDGGWVLLNHAKYRDKMSKEDRLEYQRKWDAENRKRKYDSESDKIRQNPTPPTHTHSDTSEDTSEEKTKTPPPAMGEVLNLDKQETLKQLRKDQAIELYELYPRHVGRKDALKAFERVIRDHGYEPLRKSVIDYKKFCLESGQKVRFIPYPASWANGERFNDDPSELVVPENTTPQKPTGFQDRNAIAALENKIFHHPANVDGSTNGRRVATGHPITPEEENELEKLRSELKRLKGML